MTVTLSNTSTFGVPVVTVAWLMGLVAALSAHALLKKEVDDDFNTFNDFINIDNVFDLARWAKSRRYLYLVLAV